ncbi:barstar family protein [uncultured Brevundimonas sp.]|uniref:barstar family protein n=1 Tax=uncultured Brevundimonas sp. TaxID=213418 RepID=UPI0025D005E0|nr:barstar family protein [uncultured Brevundimonas sp.]
MAYRVTIDGRTTRDRAEFYAAIDQVEGTPDWFGHNLDALFDVLVAIWPKPMRLEWSHAEVSAAAMGPDFDILSDVLRDAEKEPRSGLTVRIFEGEGEVGRYHKCEETN